MPAELDLGALITQLRRQGRLVAQTVYECGEVRHEAPLNRVG